MCAVIEAKYFLSQYKVDHMDNSFFVKILLCVGIQAFNYLKIMAVRHILEIVYYIGNSLRVLNFQRRTHSNSKSTKKDWFNIICILSQLLKIIKFISMQERIQIHEIFGAVW
jgi:hypothetical protein